MISDDFRQLLLNKLRLGRLSTKACKTSNGLVDLASLDEVTGGFWEPRDTGSKDESPEELDGDWDAVRARVVPVLGRVIDAGCQE